MFCWRGEVKSWLLLLKRSNVAPQLASGMISEHVVIPLPLGIIRVEPGHLILHSFLPWLLRQERKTLKTVSKRGSSWGLGVETGPARTRGSWGK